MEAEITHIGRPRKHRDMMATLDLSRRTKNFNVYECREDNNLYGTIYIHKDKMAKTPPKCIIVSIVQ